MKYNNIDALVIERVRFFVPAFHANAHRGDCLRVFHPKNDPSLGDVDGEAVERFWSQLAVFSKTIRNMSKSNRSEQLEDAITNIRRRVVNRLPAALKAKVNKCKKVLDYIEQCQSQADQNGIMVK
jgi:hypothetical protein